MKLDEEMRAAAYAAAEPVKLDDDYDDPILRTFAAGLRMGLERAAKVCEKSASRHARGLDDGAFNDKWKVATKCAAAIREMAND